MSIGELLERAMQVIIAFRWNAHQAGRVSPEMEAEARQTLNLLYGTKQTVEPDPLLHESDADGPVEAREMMLILA